MRAPQKRWWARRLRIHQDDARQEFALEKLSRKSREHERSGIAANEPGALFYTVLPFFVPEPTSDMLAARFFFCSQEVAHDARTIDYATAGAA